MLGMIKPKPIRISKENFQVMQPILAVARIFGLCPIFYKICGNVYTLQVSVFYGVYSYILSAVLAIATLSSVLPGKSAIGDKLAEGDRKSQYISTVNIISTSTIIVFCVLATPFKLRSLWKICDFFTEIEKTFTLDRATTYRKKSIYFISSVLGFYSVIHACDLMAWHIKLGRLDNFSIILSEYLPLYLPKYMLICQILIFCHMVYFVKIRLMYLNHNLLKSLNIYDHSDMSAVHRLFQFANSQRNIFEVVEIISNTFSFGVVLIMLSCLLHLTITPYFLLNEIQKRGSTFFICLESVWFIAHVVKVCIIIESCQQCVREGDMTIHIVQNLLSENVHEPARNALTAFTMQLCEFRIQFNICGLFRIEKSFIAIATAITTYLVILLQIKN